ncbi:hypothetical protein [Moorena sp. SIO4G3]|nr:hypothetical protein [Moorena sp. SIO4G3]NEO80366.1 hypothetical protein [Moorena sp. SIO4G3]
MLRLSLFYCKFLHHKAQRLMRLTVGHATRSHVSDQLSAISYQLQADH